MAKKGIIALMACVFALCLALVGCGGGNNNKAAFTGTWDLSEMNKDGQVTSSDDLDTLKSLGLEVYVNLNDDGTAVLSLFGEAMEGSWEATSATAGTIKLEGQQVTMTIEDSKLKFGQDGASLTFQKGEAKEAPSKEESTAATEEPAATEETAAAEEPAQAEGAESTAAAEEAAEASQSESASESASESESASSSAAA